MKHNLYLILLIWASSCTQDTNVWDIPQETYKRIITKHYQSLVLDSGEVVCGTPSEFDWACHDYNDVSHGVPGAYSDTVYYDRFNNILLIKDIRNFRQRMYYADRNKLSKQVTQYGRKNFAILEIGRDSNQYIKAIKNSVSGFIPTDMNASFEEKQTRDKQGRLIKAIRNDKTITTAEYPPSPAGKIITSYSTIEDGEKIEESTWIYDASTEKLLYSKSTQYDNLHECVTEVNYAYDDKWNCIYQNIVTTKNFEIQKWNRFNWEYNQYGDIISEHIAVYMNGKTHTVTIDGETMQEIAHGEPVDVFEKGQLWDAGGYLYEYKYNSQGEWIYRVAYHQSPEDVIQFDKQMGKPLEDLRPHPIAITVRDIQYYD